MTAKRKPTQAVDKLVGIMSKLVEDAGFELVESSRRKSKSQDATLWEAHIQTKGSLRTYATIRFSLDRYGHLKIGRPAPFVMTFQRDVERYWIHTQDAITCDFSDPGLNEKVVDFTQDLIKKIDPLDRLAGVAPNDP
jgi:hypothetical protein